MLPDSRSIQRFFSGLAEVCPVAELSHFHLIHWSAEPPSPLDPLRASGFRGKVVAARASLADALRHHHPGLVVVLDDHPTAGEQAEQVLMELPQGKEAARLAIDTALAALTPTGKLWLFGEKESGIRSLSKRYSGCETALCKGHLRLHTLTAASQPLPDKGESAPFRPQADGFACLEYDGLPIAVRPGIFSWRTIDAATRLLLEAVRETPGRSVLDWGCGSGVIGVTLARRFPEIQVVLSDDLVTATRCARRTVEMNDLSGRCTVLTEDGLGPALSRQKFDTIFTNPPFHRGVRTDHEATLAFLAQANACLNTQGSLWLVGNRFLDYGTLLRQQFGQVEEMEGDDAFTLWRALKLRKTTTHSRPSLSQIPVGRWIEADALS
ncbi:MAG: class I SAM-dependent methyltransferase [Magnetococcales bacterium]|nr:class I SAM-dependent methyltransferase [Magnetococcales bacterium]